MPRAAPLYSKFCYGIHIFLVSSSKRQCSCPHTPVASNDTYINCYERFKTSGSGKPFTFALAGKSRRHKQRRNSRKWLSDSGASVHCCNDLSQFVHISTWQPTIQLSVADSRAVAVKAMGSITLELQNQRGVWERHLLQNVCYVPDFPENILSVARLWHENRIKTSYGKSNYMQAANGSKYLLEPVGKYGATRFHAISRDRYRTVGQAGPAASISSVTNHETELWHRRFMHISQTKIRKLQKHIAKLKDYEFDSKLCDSCQCGGARKQPFVKRFHRERKPRGKQRIFTFFGEQITSDLCGPFESSVHDKCVYAIVFYDRYSHYVCVYFLPDKEKETVLAAFKKFIQDHRDLLPNGVKSFHSDNGGEYINSDMDAFCEELCINRSFTVPYAAPQNPHAERAWGILLRKMRITMHACGAPENLWTYFMSQAALVHNVCPRHGDDQIPYELVHGKAFDYKTLHAIGCKTYYMVPPTKLKSKLSERAVPAMYLGRDSERTGDLVYVPSLHYITSSYHHVFSECEYLTADDLSGSERFKVPVDNRRTRVYEDRSSTDRSSAPNAAQRDHNTTRRVHFELGDDRQNDRFSAAGDTPDAGDEQPTTPRCVPCDDETDPADLPYQIPHLEYTMCPNYPQCNKAYGHAGNCSNELPVTIGSIFCFTRRKAHNL